MALALILIWYIGIGAVAVVGSIALARKLFSAKAEQMFFGAVLVPVAAIYLPFTAYFDADGAWRSEAVAVLAFAVLGLLGMRFAALLVLGYVLHGGWDLVHELQAHAAVDVGGARLTQIPMAYGAFCATYDWGIAGYFYLRRDRWKAAWGAQAR